MNPETLQRAYEIHCHQQLAGHEAAHAAAAMLLGLRVSRVTAPFWRLEEVEGCNPDDPAGCAWMERRSDPDGLRKVAIATIAGRLEDGGVGWPPRWPLTLAPEHGDEADLCQLVEELDLDAKGYSQLVDDALELAGTQAYERLRIAISHGLELHGTLDEDALRKIKAISEGATVEHSLKAATVTTADEGEFTAIAATYSVDRQNDIIIPGAFGKTIARWQASAKNLPLHWNHQGDAHNIIGSIDPHAMRETDEGLEVSGRLDLNDSDTAREAWRSMRNNAMSLSFGYVTTKSRKRNDGINELQELDLFEISIVPAPANADTRVLSMKSADPDPKPPSLEELRARERELGLDEDHEARQRIVDEFRTLLTDAMGHTNGNGNDDSKSLAALREKAAKIEREFGEVQIASFEC